jgi:hypothetical protein
VQQQKFDSETVHFVVVTLRTFTLSRAKKIPEATPNSL